MSTPPTISVLLYGPGAIGSFYAFILSRSPHVHLSIIARSNYTAIRDHGILIKSENHGEHRFRPKAVYRRVSEAVAGEEGRVWDFVVVASKAVDVGGTVRELEGVICEGRTVVVVLQNGVGVEEVFLGKWKGLTVLSGVVWVGATQESPGVVRQHISESTTIGVFENPNVSVGKQQDDLDRFTALLEEGKTPFVVDSSIRTAKWRKCIWNAAWNSLTTLTSVDCHSWLASSEYARRTTKRLMHESAQVAKASGIPGIDDTLPEELINKMMKLPGPVWTSMYHDSRNGRAMEVEVILGTILKKGEELVVSTPTLDTLYSLMLAIDQRLEKARTVSGTTNEANK